MRDTDSPRYLEPSAKITGVSTMSKKPLYVVLATAMVLMGVLIYSVNFAHNNVIEDEEQKVVIQETEKPLLIGEGTGLSLKPPKEAVAIPDVVNDAVPNEPLIIIAKNTSVDNQEAENFRRIKTQAMLSALNSPLTVRAAIKDSEKIQQEMSFDSLSKENSSSIANPYGYDPAADRDKEGFLARSEKDTDWASPNSRMAGQPFELKTGTVIPAVMVTGVNSDLPGNLIAQVSQNVYDTANGKNLLIPHGSKLYGVYDSRVIYGQSRVLIAWNRVIFPDGSSFTLGAMPGADISGYAGFEDQVNNHYLRIFGSAFLMSMIMSGSAYAMDMAMPSGDSDKVTMQGEMISALSAQFGQTTATLLEKNLNIKPTLEIRPGYQFNVVLTKDLVFKDSYKPWSK